MTVCWYLMTLTPLCFFRAFTLGGTTYQLHDCVLVCDDINNTLEEAKVCKLMDLYDTGELFYLHSRTDKEGIW